MQPLARYMMHGRVQAIGSVVSLALLSLIVSPLAILTTAGVALVTLVQGYREGLFNLVISTVILSVFMGVAIKQPAIGIELAIMYWVPAWLLASIVRSRTSMSLALVVAAVASCLLVTGIYLFSDPAAHWTEVINNQLIPALKQAGVTVKEGPGSQKFWQLMATIMTGLVFTLFLSLQGISLLLARYWQAVLYNPGGFGQEFRQLRFGMVIAAIALAIVLFAKLTANELALNLYYIVVTLMLIQGLAVVHGLVDKCKLNPQVLIGVYLFIVFTLKYESIGLLLIALTGLLDNWINLRFRLCADKAQDEFK